MSSLTRRQFLRSSATVIALAALLGRVRAAYSNLKLGVTDWNLRQAANSESIELAKSIGFEGVQISLGRAPNSLPLSDVSIQDRFLSEAKTRHLPIASTCVDILHQNYLKNDPLGKRWVAESIPISRKLGARVILLPFFGKGALQTKDEMNYVADFLKEIGPEAEKQQVILGIENTISAEDNVRILDRAGSKAVLVYYDVGNSHRNGFDIYKEIRWLGKDRICEFHLKDNPHYMGRGAIDFEKVVQAIAEIKFDAWAHLETECPSGNVKEDMRTNLDFIKTILAKHRD